jgi:hypothetical protein
MVDCSVDNVVLWCNKNFVLIGRHLRCWVNRLSWGAMCEKARVLRAACHGSYWSICCRCWRDFCPRCVRIRSAQRLEGTTLRLLSEIRRRLGFFASVSRLVFGSWDVWSCLLRWGVVVSESRRMFERWNVLGLGGWWRDTSVVYSSYASSAVCCISLLLRGLESCILFSCIRNTLWCLSILHWFTPIFGSGFSTSMRRCSAFVRNSCSLDICSQLLLAWLFVRSFYFLVNGELVVARQRASSQLHEHGWSDEIYKSVDNRTMCTAF